MISRFGSDSSGRAPALHDLLTLSPSALVFACACLVLWSQAEGEKESLQPSFSLSPSTSSFTPLLLITRLLSCARRASSLANSAPTLVCSCLSVVFDPLLFSLFSQLSVLTFCFCVPSPPSLLLLLLLWRWSLLLPLLVSACERFMATTTRTSVCDCQAT